MMNKLRLHKEIYQKQAVLQAVRAFENIAVIHVEETEDYYCLFFKKCKADPDITIKEFENYVLIATIQNTGDLYD